MVRPCAVETHSPLTAKFGAGINLVVFIVAITLIL